MKPAEIYKSEWSGTEAFFETYVGYKELKDLQKEKVKSSEDYVKLFNKHQKI